ncbi:hypothetical protein SK069_10815 [Patulibacter brassicae]|uniref:DNA helicase n=1 Tax=Patulibacter brassicae TaxID=1705717 RepID=A0ABU4VL59_9ACTN|nr:hypothetical protein [Patulibacter brassicae]MDX8152087.1 hypothetical protein [Patulibacter brassicae]
MRFPTYQDLSKEQDDVNNLPLKGNYLVTGPPGTGKTVMALYRGKALAGRRESVQLLMHGRLLSQYTSQVVGHLGIDGVVNTFFSWLGKWCRSNWGVNTPQVEPYRPDWTRIIELAIEKPPARGAQPHLLVDEGQDMAPEFFMFAKSVAKGLTVFADENQRITDDNSTLAEIRTKIRPDAELKLTRNYRNTREIALVARHFVADSPTGVPELPERTGPKPELAAHPRTHESAQRIATYAGNFKRQQIGVIVPNDKKLLSIYRNRLAAALPDSVRLQHYSNKGKTEVEFDTPGVTLLHWASAKGLEFDAVFLPELQAVRQELGSPLLHMQLHVLCSRARERLFLSYTGEGRPAIASLLPLDLIKVVP